MGWRRTASSCRRTCSGTTDLFVGEAVALVSATLNGKEPAPSHSASAHIGENSCMGKLGVTLFVFLLCGSSLPVHAQKRVEAGLLVDYLGVAETNTPNFGLGGRFGYRVHRHVMLEGEISYGYGV